MRRVFDRASPPGLRRSSSSRRRQNSSARPLSALLFHTRCRQAETKAGQTHARAEAGRAHRAGTARFARRFLCVLRGGPSRSPTTFVRPAGHAAIQAYRHTDRQTDQQTDRPSRHMGGGGSCLGAVLPLHVLLRPLLRLLLLLRMERFWERGRERRGNGRAGAGRDASGPASGVPVPPPSSGLAPLLPLANHPLGCARPTQPHSLITRCPRVSSPFA